MYYRIADLPGNRWWIALPRITRCVEKRAINLTELNVYGILYHPSVKYSLERLPPQQSSATYLLPLAMAHVAPVRLH